MLHKLLIVILFFPPRIWSTSFEKTLRKENVSSLQRTASQCKQPFFSCFADVGGWELRVFLLSKSCGRGWLGNTHFLLGV